MHRLIVALAILSGAGTSVPGATAIPEDFPRFHVPGHEQEMATLRALFWLHYPGAGPKATLWDEWLSGPALWPAVDSGGMLDRFRAQWKERLSQRIIDTDGYVATHQHASIAHQLGWPFPFWSQGQGGYGWHFSFKNTVGPPWRPTELSSTNGWSWQGASHLEMTEEGWRVELSAPDAAVLTPARAIDTFQAPFLQLRWAASGLTNARPCIEWATKEQPQFGPARRVCFEPAKEPTVTYTMVPMFRHPEWKGEITQLRVGFGNETPGARVTIQAFFTQYDTRHNINGQNFTRGCAACFLWTRDLNFLRQNIGRMRAALRYLMDEHQALQRRVVYTDWVGHDGRSGLRRHPDGSKTILSGHGIGNNYWDLLPFGNLDCYATVHYYDALVLMARLEREIQAHPEWGVETDLGRFDPDMLERHAREVKEEGNRLFWSPDTGRFVACIDADGRTHDYGFTFLNLEAVCYDFATPDHARAIMAWIDGDRLVDGDTSRGADIYHWRFGPRSTTRRNVDWYFWAWSAPETIPWGGQVQDGGAVLGFSYHDLMARLRMRGPDNAWERLQEVIRWFDEVEAAGGYRQYYDGTRPGSLQGGGTPGGLGLDHEFFESVLVPQVILNGFLGFRPTADGCRLEPRLPADWPELGVDQIRLHSLTLAVRATRDSIELRRSGPGREALFLRLPEGPWRPTSIPADGSAGSEAPLERRPADGSWKVAWDGYDRLQFQRVGPGEQ